MFRAKQVLQLKEPLKYFKKLGLGIESKDMAMYELKFILYSPPKVTEYFLVYYFKFIDIFIHKFLKINFLPIYLYIIVALVHFLLKYSMNHKNCHILLSPILYCLRILSKNACTFFLSFVILL